MLQREPNYLELARDHVVHVVGPVPVVGFLDEYAEPEDDDAGPCPNPALYMPSLEEVKSERDLAEIINDSGVAPTLHMRDTHATVIKSTIMGKHRLPDYCLYHGDDVEVVGERKEPEQDPFIDPPAGWESWSLEQRRKHVFVNDSKEAMRVLGQLASYAELVFDIQYRTHVFQFLIFGHLARLLRWDRAGCVVTEAFDWRTTPHLWDFFWRYDLLSYEARGHDMPVTPEVSNEQAEIAIKLLKAANVLPAELDRQNFSHVTFRDEHHDGITRELIVAGHRFCAPGVEGSGTRGGLAVLLGETPRVVYLKDTWRYDCAQLGLEKEGHIYEELHRAGVDRIPEHVGSGDAGSADNQNTWQRTATDRMMKYACRGVTIFTRWHYYTILGDVGRPLTEFSSLREMCRAVFDAFTAHKEAYEKAHILHRDLSPGNILIDAHGHGLMIDWQFAKKIETGKPRQPRLSWTVGTWQFFSYARQRENPKELHDLSDDLEAFLWVILYMLVRYRPIDLSPTLHLYYMHATFDMAHPVVNSSSPAGVRRCGGEKKLAFLRDSEESFGWREGLMASIPLLVRRTLFSLAAVFEPLYRTVPPKERDVALTEFTKHYKLPEDIRKQVRAARKINDDVEADRIVDAWQAQQKRKFPMTIAPGAQKVVVDYTPVESHSVLEQILEEPYCASADLWEGDGRAEDQLPRIRRLYRQAFPNINLPNPLDPRSQSHTGEPIISSRVSQHTQSSAKRAREDEVDSRGTSSPSKRRKIASGATPSSSPGVSGGLAITDDGEFARIQRSEDEILRTVLAQERFKEWQQGQAGDEDSPTYAPHSIADTQPSPTPRR